MRTSSVGSVLSAEQKLCTGTSTCIDGLRFRPCNRGRENRAHDRNGYRVRAQDVLPSFETCDVANHKPSFRSLFWMLEFATKEPRPDSPPRAVT